jgi:hypothetical protein
MVKDVGGASYSLADLQLVTWKKVLLDPRRIVAPIWVLDPCRTGEAWLALKLMLIFNTKEIGSYTSNCSKIITSGMKITHGVFVVGSNSVLLAPCNFMIERANSITAICMPKQMPRYGMLFSRAYFAARIFPWTPLSPKPPGTNTPSAP